MRDRRLQQVNIAVRPVNAGAATAVSMSVMLLLSACSGEITPERAAAAYPPQPVIFPLQPPVPQVGNAPGGVRTALVRWFSEAGYKDFQVEALAEHAKIESGFRPCAAAPGLRYTYQWGGARLRVGSRSSRVPVALSTAGETTGVRRQRTAQ